MKFIVALSEANRSLFFLIFFASHLDSHLDRTNIVIEVAKQYNRLYDIVSTINRCYSVQVCILLNFIIGSNTDALIHFLLRLCQ